MDPNPSNRWRVEDGKGTRIVSLFFSYLLRLRLFLYELAWFSTVLVSLSLFLRRCLRKNHKASNKKNDNRTRKPEGGIQREKLLQAKPDSYQKRSTYKHPVHELAESLVGTFVERW